jgi:hypothetical protein
MPEITRKPLSWFKVNPQVRKTFDKNSLRRLGDCSRKRRFTLNQAKAAYYAAHRSRRFARRCFSAVPSQPSDQKTGAA